MGLLSVGLLAGATAAAQQAESGPAEATELSRSEAMILLDYQVLPVVGDKPIDLMGFHVLNKVADSLYLGAGLYAPLVKGAYGGFTAYDITAHAQRRLTGNLFATAGLALGGGAGGRSVENAKALSGTGSFFKAYAGLGYDFGTFSIGANLARMKFSNSAIAGTQANVFVEIPYSYLTGPFASHGQRLSPDKARQAAEGSSEKMLSVVLDNFQQQHPEGTYKGVFNIADLQYAHFFAPNTYWFAALGVGYRGLPLYNQVLGGVGQRMQLSPRITAYGQVGIGSGGYAPEILSTDAGLLVYPKVSAEYALTKDLGLSLSAGYLVAPKGSSKNTSIGIGLTHHIRAGNTPSFAGDSGGPTYQAYRVSLFQAVDAGVRYRDVDRGQVKMIGIQADAIVNDHVYIPLQAAVATNTYLGYPGYGELLAGIGLQSRTARGDHWQVFGQVMGGTNVHGLAVKASGGVRYGLND
ncbi:MAG: hypothetical protein ABI574_16855, partial [Burkholderiales bacterium]